MRYLVLVIGILFLGNSAIGFAQDINTQGISIRNETAKDISLVLSIDEIKHQLAIPASGMAYIFTKGKFAGLFRVDSGCFSGKVRNMTFGFRDDVYGYTNGVHPYLSCSVTEGENEFLRIDPNRPPRSGARLLIEVRSNINEVKLVKYRYKDVVDWMSGNKS